MSNQHYILVKNSSEENAREFISDILNKSSDVTWYDIDHVYDVKDVSQQAIVQSILDRVNSEFSETKIQKVIEYIDDLQQRVSDGNTHVYYMLGEAYMNLYRMSYRAKCEPFTLDNLKDSESFNGWHYNEYGLTNGVMSATDDDKLFLAEISVHC